MDIPTRFPLKKSKTRMFSSHVTPLVSGPTIGHGDYPKAALQGSTPHFNVYADPELWADGVTIATGILARCEKDYNMISSYFGGIKPNNLPFNVVVVDLTSSSVGMCRTSNLPGGGAYHCDCSAIDIYCDTKLTPSLDPEFSEFLNVAEFVEVLEAVQNRGWDCSASNGEGLSRVLATALYPDKLNGFNTASAWLDNGRPDWVNNTNPTDDLDVSNGCSVLFLNYLCYELGHSWSTIVQSAAPTLAGTYAKLTGDKHNPFPAFKTLMDLTFPPSSPSGLNTYNPWFSESSPTIPLHSSSGSGLQHNH